MELIRTFVRRPVTTIMIVMVFVVLGYVSYNRMVVDLFPKIEFPLVQVISIYPGAGPEEMESQIVKKIEDEVSNISDIKEMNSFISEGYAYTLVEFNLGVDIDIKALDVKDKIEQIKRELPNDAEDPQVAKFDPLSRPVVKLALTSPHMNERDLYELADKQFKNYFSQVTGVAKVDVLGGSKRQINIWAKLDKMAQYGLTITDLLAAVGQQNIDIPAGNIKQKTREIGIRFKGEAKNVEDIANLKFSTKKHGIIRIADVARVEDGSEDAKSIVRYEGKNAVLLDIYQRSDGNTIAVADGVYVKMKEVQKLLPQDVQLTIADDESPFIRNSVDNAIGNIIMGVILCAILLWIFLRDIRITFVAAAVIPTSIISAFLLMDFSGFTINIMTLMGLGISIGTLVANAIVVLENIARHMEKGEQKQDAAVMGTKEIAVAVLASAGTNIVVFTPIAFMEGMVGRFFNQFGMTVVFATIFSLIASFSLTPMLSAVFLRENQKKEEDFTWITRIIHAPLLVVEKLLNMLQAAYSISLGSVLRYPIFTCVFSFILVFSLFKLGKYVGGEFFPASDRNLVNIAIQLPKGATMEAADAVLTKVEEVVKKEIPDELEDYVASAGGENVGFDEANVKLRLVEAVTRDRSDKEIMYALQPSLAKIPGAEIFTYGEIRAGSRADIDVDVFGPDYKVLSEISAKMRQVAMDVGNFRSVYNKYRPPKDEVHFLPDAYRRSDYGVPNVVLGMALRNAIEGDDAGVLRVGGEEYDINVRLDETDRNSIRDMKMYTVQTQKGQVPMSMFGTFKQTKGIANLDRKNKARVITVECYSSAKSLTENVALLKEQFDKIEFPPGYYYKFAGAAEMQQETSTNIAMAFVLAIILTYMLLAAILDSFIHPLTIMITVPLGVVGVVVTLFFTGITFNLMSMMAVVMLVGIVVNNAILIIDYAMQQIQTTDKGLEDCMQEASVVKFRAILMTNLAIIAGIFPQVLGGSGAEFMIPMAAATMGGVAVSAVFTLFTIPALFVIIEKANRFVKKWAAIAAGKISPSAKTQAE